MYIRKENRAKVFKYLFGNGVLVAKKKFNAPRHPDINIPNIEVLKTMQSLQSMGYVTSKFLWQAFYYTLTDKGIEFLRENLHVPDDVVPSTLAPRSGPTETRMPRSEGPSGPRSGPSDRSAYRHEGGRFGAEKKLDGAPSSFNPAFSGLGRGRTA